MTHQTIYIESPGTIVRRQGGALVAEQDKRIVLRLPLHRLRRLLLWSQTHITTPALRMALSAGVDVALLSRRGLVGTIRPPLSGSVALLLAQIATYRAPAQALVIAKALITAKLTSQARLLRSARRASARHHLLPVAAALTAQRDAVDAATDLATLRGVEGATTRRYFAGYGALIQPPLRFTGRARRPPPDPINALLSLGYMLLVTEIGADLEARGFDPRLGLMHAVRSGRPALALDLMEPWRAPIVDRLVANLVNRGVLGPDDFEAGPSGGVRLNPPAFARFLDAWERHLGPRQAPEPDVTPSLRRQLAAWIDSIEARLLADQVDR